MQVINRRAPGGTATIRPPFLETRNRIEIGLRHSTFGSRGLGYLDKFVNIVSILRTDEYAGSRIYVYDLRSGRPKDAITVVSDFG